MSLVPSLLQAIVKVDGEAMVMHAGDKPYVVSPTGQVELASRGLTLEAVNGIAGQLLPIEIQNALEEFGAIQYELPAAPEFPGEHFTVVAARGGDDVWVEIRRRRVNDDDRVPEEFFAPASAQPTPDAVDVEPPAPPAPPPSPMPEPFVPQIAAAPPPPPIAAPSLEAEAEFDAAISAIDEPEADEPEVEEQVASAEPVEVPVDESIETEDDDLGVPDETQLWPARSEWVEVSESETSEADGTYAGDATDDEAAEVEIEIDIDEPMPAAASMWQPPPPPPVAPVAPPIVDLAPAADMTLVTSPSAIVHEAPAAASAAFVHEASVAPPSAIVHEAPVSTPAAIVHEAPMEAPAAIEYEAPVEAPAAIAHEAPMEAPAAIVYEAPVEAPAIVYEAPVEAPAAILHEALVEAPVAILHEAPVEAPAAILHEALVEAPAAILHEAPVAAPAATADEAPVLPPAPVISAAAAATLHEPPPQAAVPSPPPPAPRAVEPPAPVLAAPRAVPPAEPVEPPKAVEPPHPVAPPQPAVVLPISRNPIRAEAPPPLVPDPTLSGLERLLRVSSARGASTLYLSSESRPSVRVDGELQILDGEPVHTSRDVESLLLTLMPERSHEALRTGALTEWICDIEGVGRVRCMSFRDHRGPGGVFRLMPTRSVSVEQLGLPKHVQALAIEPEGLVLVAGPRSSGKRTLMAAFVDLMNRTRRDHIITIEREINIVHDRGNSFISQREVRGNDDELLAAARGALREDPDVLLIEDLRTGGLMNVALEAAASGHLVIGGFSAHTATGAIDRIIDLYAPEYRRQVQFALADSLRGVIVQVLLRKVGGGRLPAREVLLNTPAVSSVIAEGKTSQLPMAIEGGRRYGMMPMNDALVGLVQAGAVEARDAYRQATDRPGFLAALNRQGIDTSFVERLA
jgi:twitching motility protein PilT